MKNFILSVLPFFLVMGLASAQSYTKISMDLSENMTYVSQIGSNEFLFSFAYTAPTDTDLELEVILPPDYIVVDRGGLLISRPFYISTDGRRITIIWKNRLIAGENFAAFVQYESRPSTSFNVIIITMILIGALGVYGGYRLNEFKKDRFIKKVLSEDESKVVEEIKKKGEILQEELRDSLGWSKTKISKIVRNLEAKNIIYKKPYKKTNKLKIK